MRALLLAAGIGSRLRPITSTIPKCLVPIHGRPLLDIWLDHLFKAGIERVLINTHYLPEQVQDFVSGSEWASQVDLVHEERLLGTAGTIRAVRDYFRGADYLTAHADNLTDFDVAAFREAHEHRPENCAMTMLPFETDDPQSCGILELDEDRVVQMFHEKVENPPGNLANAAVYILGDEIADYIESRKGECSDLSTQVIPGFVGRIYCADLTPYHRDIGNLQSLERAHVEYQPDWKV